jgi:putative membrane protein insertion efficiency factor
MKRLAVQIVRLPANLMIGLVRAYQAVVSPHMAPTCRYSPSCSNYAVEAFRKYGLVRGFVLSVHRILRCHPWGGQGFDPPIWYSETSETKPASHEH